MYVDKEKRQGDEMGFVCVCVCMCLMPVIELPANISIISIPNTNNNKKFDIPSIKPVVSHFGCVHVSMCSIISCCYIYM
jgi:hypothetical protein